MGCQLIRIASAAGVEVAFRSPTRFPSSWTDFVQGESVYGRYGKDTPKQGMKLLMIRFR